MREAKKAKEQSVGERRGGEGEGASSSSSVARRYRVSRAPVQIIEAAEDLQQP